MANHNFPFKLDLVKLGISYEWEGDEGEKWDYVWALLAEHHPTYEGEVYLCRQYPDGTWQDEDAVNIIRKT